MVSRSFTTRPSVIPDIPEARTPLDPQTLPVREYPVETVENSVEEISDLGESPFPVPPVQQYLINSTNSKLLSIVDGISARGDVVNVMVSGPQGVGKSELAEQYAATRGRPYAVVEVGRLSDPSQIFGYMDLREGETTYVPGIFTKAITYPGTVIHLQEINRPENDKALNALFSVLDDKQRRIWVDEMSRYVEVAPGVVFFATLNEGFEFIGTLPLDKALRNRFPIKIVLKKLPHAEEMKLLTMKQGLNSSDANLLMNMVEGLRNNSQHPTNVSTRDMMFMALLIKEGADVDLAIATVIGGDSDAIENMNLSKHMKGESYYKSGDSYQMMEAPERTGLITFRNNPTLK